MPKIDVDNLRVLAILISDVFHRMQLINPGSKKELFLLHEKVMSLIMDDRVLGETIGESLVKEGK